MKEKIRRGNLLFIQESYKSCRNWDFFRIHQVCTLFSQVNLLSTRVKSESTRVCALFTRVKTLFTWVNLLPTWVKSEATRVNLIFIPVKNEFTWVNLEFTWVKSLSIGVNSVSTSSYQHSSRNEIKNSR